jgi:hypothetical protein
MKRWMLFILVLGLIVLLAGCRKDLPIPTL